MPNICLPSWAGIHPTNASASTIDGGPGEYEQAFSLAVLMYAAQRLDDTQLAMQLLSCAAGAPACPVHGNALQPAQGTPPLPPTDLASDAWPCFQS